MFCPEHDKRDRLIELGFQVRKRIREEIYCLPRDKIVDSISYPGPEEPMHAHSADDD